MVNFGFHHLSEPLDYLTGLYVSHGVQIIELLLYFVFYCVRLWFRVFVQIGFSNVNYIFLIKRQCQIKPGSCDCYFIVIVVQTFRMLTANKTKVNFSLVLKKEILKKTYCAFNLYIL